VDVWETGWRLAETAVTNHTALTTENKENSQLVLLGGWLHFV
jgi:hypothetical protein